MKRIATFILCIAVLVGCDGFIRPDMIIMPDSKDEATENPEPEPEPEPEGIIPFTPESVNDPGVAYVWDENVVPEIIIHISKDEWNRLLERYDEFNNNVDYFHADFTYKKGRERIFIQDGGVRLRGNTSRRRPEGNTGQPHDSDNPDWHHCHFGINFRKYHKDSDHTVHGIRKINLKWFKDDPCYVRELYCYDLFRRYGIWTSAFSTYCRLWIQIDNEKAAYFGVYNMIEPIDDEFVERREDGMFENDKGYLWKCVYGAGGMADFRKADEKNSNLFNWDQDNGINYTYEFKGDKVEFATARTQLVDFIKKLNSKQGEDLHSWLAKVFDMEFLMKTYAVNVAVGMWDDHWGNGNNFYMYFNGTGLDNYKVFFLPYDYDNSLGTSAIMEDAGRQDPYNWGDAGILMEKILQFDDFIQMYKNAFQELADPANDLFHMNASVPRIMAWQNMIMGYVSNDTREDMSVIDRPASWSNHPEYRLVDTGSNNWFHVKTEVINSMQ